MTWLYAAFVLSGFAALLYQVVWQRALFAIYGANVEAVTVVVTAFILGLGIGSLIGGALSKRARWPLLLVFAAIEAGLGLYGCASLALFRAVGAVTLHWSALGTGIATFLLVLGPTLLMGATLPLLVAHQVAVSRNVGRSVGELYLANTLGSALASLAAVVVLLGWLGEANTVRLAALFNFTVSGFVIVQHRRGRA